MERFASALPMIYAVIAGTANGQPRNARIHGSADDKSRFTAELQQLQVDEPLVALLPDILFPEGIPVSGFFFERFCNLHCRLPWVDESDELTALVLTATLQKLGSAAETLLTHFPEIPGPDFFLALSCLPAALKRVQLQPEFARVWFMSMAKRIGNDGGGEPFWTALIVFAESHPDISIQIMETLAAPASEEISMVGALLLGVLRTVALRESKGRFLQAERSLRESTDISLRMIYFRSWIHTSARVGFTREQFENVIGRMWSGSNDEKDSAFWIVHACAARARQSADCLEWATEWMTGHLEAARSMLAHYHVLSFAEFLLRAGRKEGLSWAVALQPLDAQEKGAWGKIIFLLTTLLDNDLAAFKILVMELHGKAGKVFRELFNDRDNRAVLVYRMRQYDLSDLVSTLLFTDTDESCLFGIQLFELLPNTTLSAKAMTAPEAQIRRAFYQGTRALVRGGVIARFLLELLPAVGRLRADFETEFENEAVLQGKNYGGVCREAFIERQKDSPLLGAAVARINAYFEALDRIRKSPIIQMDVQGHDAAYRLSARRFSQAVSEGSERMSAFAGMFKKAQLVYGKMWSHFHENTLSPPTALQEISASSEIPRLEFIDPEGMIDRRIIARHALGSLSSEPEEGKADVT
jgi:hypothetical protein